VEWLWRREARSGGFIGGVVSLGSGGVFGQSEKSALRGDEFRCAIIAQ
jgi:hypothetical protein